MIPPYRSLFSYSEHEYKVYADNLIEWMEEEPQQAIQLAIDIEVEGDQEVSEIRDYALLNMAVKLAAKKQIEEALEVVPCVNNFEKMAFAFQEIAGYAENLEQREKIQRTAENTLNQGSRPMMSWGEMKRLPELLKNTLEGISSRAEGV